MSSLRRYFVAEWTALDSVFKALKEIHWLGAVDRVAISLSLEWVSSLSSSSSSLSSLSSSQMGSPSPSSSQISSSQDIIFCFFLFFWALMLSWPESSLSLSELKILYFYFLAICFSISFSVICSLFFITYLKCLRFSYSLPGAGGWRWIAAGVACHTWLCVHINLKDTLRDRRTFRIEIKTLSAMSASSGSFFLKILYHFLCQVWYYMSRKWSSHSHWTSYDRYTPSSRIHASPRAWLTGSEQPRRLQDQKYPCFFPSWILSQRCDIKYWGKHLLHSFWREGHQTNFVFKI